MQVEEFTKNIEQKANLTQMNYIAPVYSHGMTAMANSEKNVKTACMEYTKKILLALK